MIEVWDAAALSRNPDTRTQLYRFRYRVFSERLAWTPQTSNCEETDEFDGTEIAPVFLLSRRDDGSVNGCVRLLPTTGPYMLRDTFGQLLVGQTAPCSASIWEASRFCVDVSDYNDAGRLAMSRTAITLIQGMCEFGFKHEIQSYLFVVTATLADFVRRLGINPAVVTKSVNINGVNTVAASCQVSSAAHERIIAYSGCSQAIILDYRSNENFSRAA